MKKQHRLSRHKAIALTLTASFALLGALVPLICDLALFHTLTWSLIPIFSLAFFFFIVVALILCGIRRLFLPLCLFSLLLYPYLFSLNFAIGRLCPADITAIAFPVAGVFLVFLWLAFLFGHILSGRPLLIGALLSFLTLPLQLAINLILSRKLGEQFSTSGTFTPWESLLWQGLSALPSISPHGDLLPRKKATF